MSGPVTLAIAELVEDLAVYPRHAVDDSHVAALAQAIEAGHDLPPVVACVRSKRIVDGWHRIRARRRVHGVSATVDVVLKEYQSEADLVEDAIRLNAAHGRRLDAMDRTRAVLMLKRHDVPAERIALVLRTTPKVVKKLEVRVATATTHVDATVPGTKTIVLKRPVAHLQGRKLTREQAEAHDSMPGTSFLLLSNQLRMAMRTGLVNREDGRLMDGLRGLQEELQTFLA